MARRTPPRRRCWRCTPGADRNHPAGRDSATVKAALEQPDETRRLPGVDVGDQPSPRRGSRPGHQIQRHFPGLRWKAERHPGSRARRACRADREMRRPDAARILAIADRVAIQDPDVSGWRGRPVAADERQQVRRERPPGVTTKVVGSAGPVRLIEVKRERAGALGALRLYGERREKRGDHRAAPSPPFPSACPSASHAATTCPLLPPPVQPRHQASRASRSGGRTT